MVEFDNLQLSDLRLDSDCGERVGSGTADLKPIVSIHGNLGVGVVELWLSLGDPVELRSLLPLRDPERLYGRLASAEWTRLCGTGVGEPVRIRDFVETLKRAAVPTPPSFRTPLVAFLFGDRAHPNASFHDDPLIEPYPVFHLHMMERSARDIQLLKKQEGKLLRALVTGDANWDVKKENVVSNLLSRDFSTRDSLVWLTHSEGSLKIYSRDLETPLRTSQALIIFELGIMLAMKHFLHRADNQLLSQPGVLSPSELLRRRNDVASELEEFYNLEVCGKDTTIGRLEAFKRELHLDHMRDALLARFEHLNGLVSSVYQSRQLRSQDRITGLLAALAALAVVSSFLFYFVQSGHLEPNPERDLFVAISSGAAAYALVGILSLLRR